MALWFSFLGPPLAWTLHVLIGYGYEEAACDNGTGVGAVEPVIVVATGLLGVVTILAGVAGWSIRRAVRAGHRDDPRGRVAFVSTIGALWTPLFLFAIVLGGAGLVALEPCAAA